MSKFNQTCWKIFSLSSNLCGKIFRSIQDVLSFCKPIEVQRFNLSSPNYIWWLQLRRLVSPSFDFCFLYKIFDKSLVIVEKNSCQSKLLWMFRSNSKFKILTSLDYNELWRLDSSSYNVHFQSYFFLKLCILVFCVTKISYQSKKLWVIEKHFNRRRFNPRVCFLQLFLLLFWHFEAIL